MDVARLLILDQKHTGMNTSQEKLILFEANWNSFLEAFLNQKGFWISYFESETKRQSINWRHPLSPASTFAKSITSQENLILLEANWNGFLECLLSQDEFGFITLSQRWKYNPWAGDTSRQLLQSLLKASSAEWMILSDFSDKKTKTLCLLTAFKSARESMQSIMPTLLINYRLFLSL